MSRLPLDSPKPRVPPAPPSGGAAGPAPEVWEAERERLLELLAQQQRVAQSGLVTSGLIHDVNNHLTMISGSAYLALQSPRPEDWRTALDRVQEQCSELAETMRVFLAFVKRRDEEGSQSFRIAEVLHQAKRLVHPLAKEHDVAVTIDVESDGEVRGQLRLAVQAIVNLATNAIRACGGRHRGQVTLAVSTPSDGQCRLEVRDTGPGIPEEIRRRLFRPFSTTHGQRDGHGLGLFVVRQAVRQMGGGIRVCTSPLGTTFTIDLPSV